MIIGLTGTLSAGKGTVVDFLKKKGFKHFSVREFLIEEIQKRNLPVNRDFMVEVANDLRARNGASFIVEKLYEKSLEFGGDCVIESVRTVGEVEALRGKKDFFLVAIDAEPRIRYERALTRASETDRISFEKFLEDERREMISEDKGKQNLKKCIEMADLVLFNNGSLEEFYKKLELAFSGVKMKKISKRSNYLSWDEYFMGIAFLSAQRSKDPSTQVGACIVDKNKKIVGIGYNGFPIGCSDEELPWAREGNFLETKYAYVCHAELNAIVNSLNRNLEGCVIYVSMFPCNECAKIIIQSGIKEVVYLSDKYAETDIVVAAKKMFNQAGVKYRKLDLSEKKIILDFNVQ